MGVKHRYIDRSDWQIPVERRARALRLPDGAFAHRLDIIRMTEPVYGSTGRISDSGWTWLSWMRPDMKWACTAMRDETGEWRQWYFDIVSGMGCDEDGRAWFDDCYLDVVMLPGGRCELLDEDELDEALANGSIDEETYLDAKRTAEALTVYLAYHEHEILGFTEKLFRMFDEQDQS